MHALEPKLIKYYWLKAPAVTLRSTVHALIWTLSSYIMRKRIVVGPDAAATSRM